ncbi:HXXEE domain-containing protein [Microbispora sp. RL4-1S]|uniref:HXXEE domain-containing protein n=1 Tax=Microbispora oryzae TaxID=2806554 RepID=A0A941AID0_9ACTN|nr:HXXEE domain-containing protein [Microbispora oryzae]MBP2705026.1 HXXEE domain-containing protein [Microbispora oryzae]
MLLGLAATDGARTGGPSFYQRVVVGFGLHGVAHLGESVALRGYTPGVVTSSVPFRSGPGTACAERIWCARSTRVDLASSAALVPVAILGVHGAAHGIGRLARRALRHR